MADYEIVDCYSCLNPQQFDEILDEIKRLLLKRVPFSVNYQLTDVIITTWLR